MKSRWTERLHPEGNLAKGDGVARRQRHRLRVFESGSVVKRPVARAEIAHSQAIAVDLQLGVLARYRRIEDGDVAGRSTPDDELYACAQLVLLKPVGARQPVPHYTWHCRWNMASEAWSA